MAQRVRQTSQPQRVQPSRQPASSAAASGAGGTTSAGAVALGAGAAAASVVGVPAVVPHTRRVEFPVYAATPTPSRAPQPVPVEPVKKPAPLPAVPERSTAAATPHRDARAGHTQASGGGGSTLDVVQVPGRAAKGSRPRWARGLSKGGKAVSKAQQKLFFARPDLRPFAHAVARRGAAFDRLPEHKRRRKP